MHSLGGSLTHAVEVLKVVEFLRRMALGILLLTSCADGDARRDGERVGSRTEALCQAPTVTISPSTSPAQLGAVLTLTAAASCAAADRPEYAFWYMSEEHPTPVLIRDYGEPTAQWETTGLHAGRYNLVVRARTGTAVSPTSKPELLLGAVCDSVTLAAPEGEPPAIGQPLRVTANASCHGNAQPEYQFWVYRTAERTNTQQLLRDWGPPTLSIDTSSWASGNYAIVVQARGQGNGWSESHTTRTYLVGNVCTDAALQPTPKTGPSGVVVDLIGKSRCFRGARSEYRFSYRRPGSNTEYLIQDYSQNPARWNTLGLEPGNYLLFARVRAVGNAAVSAHEDIHTVGFPLLSAPPQPPGSVACLRNDVAVLDVAADFRDIAAGRETVATGKRADPSPSITLRFNRAVDPNRIPARLIGVTAGAAQQPADCVDPSGNPIAATMLHDTRLRATTSAGSWNTALLGFTQAAPLDFNLVAFETVRDVPELQGPLLAGGDVTLQDFKVNAASGRPLGVVVAGTFRGTRGTVTGALARGSTPALSSVGVTGAQHEMVPLDIGLLSHRLKSLSQSLAALAPTGTVAFANSRLDLSGANTTLNIFAVDAAQLAQARSLQLAIPAGSAALVNLVGADVAISNLQIQLGGAARGSVLWNLASAETATLSGTTFQGSMLAPTAAVSASTGYFEGTLVAHSVAGNARFRHYPLTSWELFSGRPGASDTITFLPNAPLRAGCEYRFVIDRFSMTQDGACLAAPFDHSFLVANDHKTRFDREVGARRFDRRLEAPTSFAAKDGVNTPVEETFDRYAAALKLRAGIDALAATGPAVAYRPNPARQLTRFKQTYRGVPVDGYGYQVQHQGGVFRSAVGHLLSGLSLSTTPAISAQQAVDAALAAVNPSSRPWQGSAPAASPPATELRIRLRDTDPESPNPELVWRVRFSGIPEAAYSDVNATTGAVAFTQPTAFHIDACPNIDWNVATFDGQAARPVRVPVTTTRSLGLNDMQIGVWRQNNALHEVFRTLTPFAYTASYSTPVPLRVTDPVCLPPTPDIETQSVAAAYWSVQAAAGMFLDYFGWLGIRGENITATPLQLVVHNVGGGPDEATTFIPSEEDSAPDQIHAYWKELFLGAVEHEFAHGVSTYSRQEYGLELLENERESGALGEAYADIMGALSIHRSVQDPIVDPWCVSIFGTSCDRNLANPSQSISTVNGQLAPRPLPDTFGAGDWRPIDPPCREKTNGLCHIHANSTVVSHWFHELVNGRSASETNDLGCASSVTALDPDLDASMRDAGLIVFEAFAQLDETADFLQARTATSTMAEELFGPEARASVEDAWHAVGVGDAAMPLILEPADGATDVEPWDARLEFSVGDDTGPWVLRYAKSPSFDDAQTTVIYDQPCQSEQQFHCVFGEGALRTARVRFPLDASTRYYWQAREGDGSNAAAWETCRSFTASFETAEKPVRVVTPARVEKEGYYLTDLEGRVTFDEIPGAWDFDALLSETDDGCGRPTEDWTPLDARGVYLGNTLDFNHLPLLEHEPPVLSPPDILDPDRTYHLFVRARTLEGKLGTCSHFKVRKPHLLPFQTFSPAYEDVVSFNSGGPFVFSPAEGAERYRIDLDAYPSDREARLGQLGSETFEAAPLVPDADGNIHYTLRKKSLTTATGHLVWHITAIDDDTGRERRATHSVPGIVFNETSFWNGAEALVQAKFAHDGEGRVGPVVDNIGVATLQFSSMQFPRSTAVCLTFARNTIGALWWFGPASVTDVSWEDLQDAPFDPDVGGEPPYDYDACIYGLQLTEEHMRMILVPYSNLEWNDQPQGFGPATNILVNTVTCGAVDGECCPEPLKRCTSQAVCEDNVCRPCGMIGDPCCTNTGCQGINTFCRQDGTETGTCKPCGGLNQDCCDTGSSCNSEELVCDRKEARPRCHKCGAINDRCCGGSCPFADGAECIADRCVAPRRCDGVYKSPADGIPSTYQLETGQTSGVATLRWGTRYYPDGIDVFYEGMPVFSSGCLATDRLKSNPSTRPSTTCAFPGGAFAWSECTTQIEYSGTSTQLTVQIAEGCPPQDGYPGGLDGWWYQLQCE